MENLNELLEQVRRARDLSREYLRSRIERAEEASLVVMRLLEQMSKVEELPQPSWVSNDTIEFNCESVEEAREVVGMLLEAGLPDFEREMSGIWGSSPGWR